MPTFTQVAWSTPMKRALGKRPAAAQSWGADVGTLGQTVLGPQTQNRGRQVLGLRVTQVPVPMGSSIVGRGPSR